MATDTSGVDYGGRQTTPKYETPQDELPQQEALKRSIPGSPEAQSVADPESASLGKEYEPGSASTVAPQDLPRE